jgi:hypothetical protein
VSAASSAETAERTALLAQLEAACKREADAREAFLASTAELRAENEQLRHRLANPCNGEDGETGGDAHCRQRPEVDTVRVAAEIDAGPDELRSRSWWSGYVRNGPPGPAHEVIEFPDGGR